MYLIPVALSATPVDSKTSHRADLKSLPVSVFVKTRGRWETSLGHNFMKAHGKTKQTKQTHPAGTETEPCGKGRARLQHSGCQLAI